ncbi:dTDP-4-dehydrorhamnose 3,5-epimerase [soil metagenome]
MSKLEVRELSIPDIKILTPAIFEDERGSFSETFSFRALASVGLEITFVQMNQSFSRKNGTVRGLHFQRPPSDQDKLVMVTQGSIWDVGVDLRVGSPFYGRYAGEVISAKAGNQIFIPKGFAHGFCTLEPDTKVVYLVNNYYSAPDDDGLCWDDPSLALPWPCRPDAATVSDKDRAARSWESFESPFSFVDA